MDRHTSSRRVAAARRANRRPGRFDSFGEAVAVRWEDVDLDATEHVARITGTVVRVKGVGVGPAGRGEDAGEHAHSGTATMARRAAGRRWPGETPRPGQPRRRFSHRLGRSEPGRDSDVACECERDHHRDDERAGVPPRDEYRGCHTCETQASGRSVAEVRSSGPTTGMQWGGASYLDSRRSWFRIPKTVASCGARRRDAGGVAGLRSRGVATSSANRPRAECRRQLGRAVAPRPDHPAVRPDQRAAP